MRIHVVQVEEQDNVHFAVAELLVRDFFACHFDVFEIAQEQHGNLCLAFMVHAFKVEDRVLIIESQHIAQQLFSETRGKSTHNASMQVLNFSGS